MATSYDTLVGDAAATINYLPSAPEIYPAADQVTVFGPVYLPRIYGKSLTAFELASSGKVAVTLRDNYAFDLDYNATTNAATIETVNDQSLQLSAGSGSTQVLLGANTKDLTLSADSNIVFNANGLEYAIAGSVNSVFGGDNTMQSGGSTYIIAGSNMELSAGEGSISLVASDSNVWQKLDATACNLTTYALNNINLAASNAIHAEALASASLSALTGPVVLSAAGSNAGLTLAGAGATLSALSNLTFTASNTLSLWSSNGSTLASASNVAISASNAITAEALTSASLSALTGPVVLSAAGSNTGLTLAGAGATLSALSNLTFTASNTLSLWSSNGSTLASASNVLLAVDSTECYLDRNTFYAAASNHEFNATDASLGYAFKVQDADIVKITGDKVTINKDLEVLGTLNSITVQETELHINDKTVQLAYPVTGEPAINDGPLNSQAGLVIAGLPSSASNITDATLASKVYEKSFKWNYGSNGIDAMLTNPGLETEAFWELKGGRLQMSSTKTDGSAIGFALRINENDELELVKMWDTALGARTYRRIAKFGRSIL